MASKHNFISIQLAELQHIAARLYKKKLKMLKNVKMFIKFYRFYFFNSASRIGL